MQAASKSWLDVNESSTSHASSSASPTSAASAKQSSSSSSDSGSDSVHNAENSSSNNNNHKSKKRNHIRASRPSPLSALLNGLEPPVSLSSSPRRSLHPTTSRPSCLRRLALLLFSSSLSTHTNALILRLIEPTSFVLAAITAYLLFYLFDISLPWVLVDVWIFGQGLTILLSVYFASKWIRRRRGPIAQVVTQKLTTVNDYTPQRCKPPQVVRWDFLGVLASNAAGQIASLPLPVWFRKPFYTFGSRLLGVNLDEVKYPLSHFRCLQEFFTRELKDGLRPIADTPVVSPVDGRVVIVGQVAGDRVEQVKGVTYSLSQFLGKAIRRPPGEILSSPNKKPENSFPYPIQRRTSRSNIDLVSVVSKEPSCGGISLTRRNSRKTVLHSSACHCTSSTHNCQSLVSVVNGDAGSAGSSSSSCTCNDRCVAVSNVDSLNGDVLKGGAAWSDRPPELEDLPEPDELDEDEAEAALEDEDYFGSDDVEDSPLNIADQVLPGNKLFHCVIYLSPKDYHRIHAPSHFTVKHLRHFPGTLFPISPLVARLIPNLFSLNERVVLSGEWEHGFFSYTAVGAYNVGSIALNFDPSFGTNKFRRDFRNPNLELFSYRGIGCFAYDKPYSPAIDFEKGEELGCFKLGSTVVLIFEAPADFQFLVGPGEAVKLGQPLGRCSETSPP